MLYIYIERLPSSRVRQILRIDNGPVISNWKDQGWPGISMAGWKRFHLASGASPTSRLGFLASKLVEDESLPSGKLT